MELSDGGGRPDEGFLQLGRHGKGRGRGDSDGESEFKNHGQMVKACTHAGIHGKDLASVAKGETTIDKATIEAIDKGDMTFEQFKNAQSQIQDGQLTGQTLSQAMTLMKE